MLTVIDLSNHQAGTKINSLKADAFIFKATEGTNFIDHTCDTFVQQAKQLNKPYGVYHFLDQTDVIQQAHFFLKHIKGYLGEALLVLDYEGYGKQGSQKAHLFLQTIFKETGIKPLIYMNESDANSDNWLGVVNDNYGLWVAKYATNPPKVAQWASIAMWQFTSTPVDTSTFYGDVAAWKKYATPQTAKDTKKRYHTAGQRFRALKDLIVKADESWKENIGMVFSKSSVFDIKEIRHTKTTTHALIQYNHREVFVTLHRDYVEKIN